MRTRNYFNMKRRMIEPGDRSNLEDLGQQVSYSGNPQHKRAPGDFGLLPPSQPRPDKTLCDGANIVSREQAEALLRGGFRKGLVSVQMRGQFPQNVWSVTEDGLPVEAQLENRERGVYHGYPMPSTDPFREIVIRRWREAP